MKLCPSILLLCISVSLFSQQYTYFGAELGLTNPRLLYSNTSAISFQNDFGHSIFGCSIRRELGEKISLETGYSHHIYMDCFQVDQIYVYPGAFSTHQIPILLCISNDIYKDRIQLFASIGSLLCIDHSGGLGGIIGIGYDGFGKRVSVAYEETTRFYSLIGGELGLNFRIVDELLLSLTGGFHYGFKKIRNYDVEYWDEDVLLSSLKTYSKGEFWKIGVGFSYPLGRIRKLVREAYDSDFEEGTLRK